MSLIFFNDESDFTANREKGEKKNRVTVSRGVVRQFVVYIFNLVFFFGTVLGCGFFLFLCLRYELTLSLLIYYFFLFFLPFFFFFFIFFFFFFFPFFFFFLIFLFSFSLFLKNLHIIIRVFNVINHRYEKKKTLFYFFKSSSEQLSDDGEKISFNQSFIFVLLM